jgi:hypothetical protein
MGHNDTQPPGRRPRTLVHVLRIVPGSTSSSIACRAWRGSGRQDMHLAHTTAAALQHAHRRTSWRRGAVAGVPLRDRGLA